MHWLLSPDYADHLAHAFKSRALPDAIQCAQFTEKMEQLAASSDLPKGYAVAGNRARLSIEGVLTLRPSFMLWWYGIANTTYVDLIKGVQAANLDSSVKEIELYSDSPGGEVNGLFEALEALHASGKTIVEATARNAHSAAYGLVSAAKKIKATSIGASFGSVGVVATYRFFSDVEDVNVTSTHAGDKRPDVRTPEGRATVVRELDEIEDLFITAIARGRGIEAKEVREHFGQGASFLAREAKRRGMVDVVPVSTITSTRRAEREASEDEEPPTATKETAMDPKTMTFAEFQQVNPTAAQAGIDLGVKNERARVCGHLDLVRDVSGDHGMAAEDIRSGAEVSLTVGIKHMSAKTNKQTETNRQEATDRVSDQLDGAGAGASGDGGFGKLLAQHAGKSESADAGEDFDVYLGKASTGNAA